MGSLSPEEGNAPRTKTRLGQFNEQLNHGSETAQDLAIVGMSCRWPGNISSPNQLWDFLESGRDAYEPFPEDRINAAAFQHPKKGRPGSFRSGGGCFLRSPYDFDPTRFGINPQEAMSMDPAQRKLLEVVYEAFESSGSSFDSVSGSQTGCFVGNFNQDHQLMLLRDAEYPQPYGLTGSGLAILSNRISYCFNLKGPCMTLDTACSSSLYALHLACSAIQNGDCRAAIVAGANLILSPELELLSSDLGTVSASGRCHTFDEAADGYARAEGVAAFYIKRMDDALANRDPIRSVIRSTAVNANGKTGGITRPSSDGQEFVMRKAYQRANLRFSSSSYVECHGTGTPVGDPIEVAAVGRVFQDSHSSEKPLLIGSVKSNLGHGEAVSGILGVMKVSLALQHHLIPPTVGLKKLNPNIDLRDGALRIVTQNTPWPAKARRISSVNSFGYGGSNAHVILESVESFLSNSDSVINGSLNALPKSLTSQVQSLANDLKPRIARPPRDTDQDVQLLTISAHNKSTLRANIDAIRSFANGCEIRDLAYTLSRSRSDLAERSFAIVDGRALANGKTPDFLPSKRVRKSETPNIAFIMTGQGAQWPSMGLDLLARFQVCRETLYELDRHLQHLREPPKWTLEEQIKNPSLDTSDASIAQPLTTCVQIMVVNALKSWKIEPAACLGHSSGEIAAAYAAGLIDTHEAIDLAYLRGLSLQRNKRDGSMLAVGMGDRELRARFDLQENGITTACFNSPKSVTLSGNSNSIAEIKAQLEGSKTFARKLETGNNAYHSPHMQEVGREYEAKIHRDVPDLHHQSFRQPQVAFFSTVTGKREPTLDVSADYWTENLESPVKFEQAVTETITKMSVDTFIEIGPHSSLKGPVRDIAEACGVRNETEYIATLVRGQNSAQCLLTTVGQMWASNYPVDFELVIGSNFSAPDVPAVQMIADFPNYQWQYEKRLLSENRWTKEWRMRKHPRHDLIGSQVVGGSGIEKTWRNVLRRKDIEWLQHHQILGKTIFPAAGYISMVIEAAKQTCADEATMTLPDLRYELESVSFDKALILPDDDQGVEVFVAFSPLGNATDEPTTKRFGFRISSTAEAMETAQAVNNLKPVEHCSGKLEYHAVSCGVSQIDRSFEIDDVESQSAARWYDQFDRLGMRYRESFQRLNNIRASKDCASAMLIPRQPFPGESAYVIHPTEIDAAFQVCIIASHHGSQAKLIWPYLPRSIASLTLYPPSKEAASSDSGDTNGYNSAGGEVTRTSSKGSCLGKRGLRADFQMQQGRGTRIEVENMVFLSTDQAPAGTTASREPFSRMHWIPHIHYISTESANRLYPPLPANTIERRLENLVILQLVEFHTSNPALFQTGSDIPHLQRFLDWSKRQIDLIHQEQHHLSREVAVCSAQDRRDLIRSLSNQLCEISSEARLFCHIYDNLDAIFGKKKTGIEVALEDGRLDDIYKTGHRIAEGNRRLAEITALAAKNDPSIQILEVGAGTGSATAEILARLNKHRTQSLYEAYTYTDVTPYFLHVGQERFGDQPGMSYSIFNIEKDSEATEASERFDIVVASNVVHATSDILHTLRNLRKVLKKNGKLLLLEITTKPLVAGLLLGTFSDFWKGEEDKNYPREGGPFLSKKLWQTALSEAGFNGVDFFLDDYADRPCSTVICATAANTERKGFDRLRVKNEGVSFVSAHSTKSQAPAFKAHTQSLYQEVDIISLSGIEQPRYRNLVFLEIEKAVFESMNYHELARVQALLAEAKTVIWITHGNLMRGEYPERNMINGIVNAIQIEKPAVKFVTIDLDHPSALASREFLDLFQNTATYLFTPEHEKLDSQLRLSNGIIHCGRMMLEESLNLKQAIAQGQEMSTVVSSLKQLQDNRLQMVFPSPGIADSLLFKDTESFSEALGPGLVKLEVQAACLSPQNIESLLGKSLSTTSCNDCAGIIESVGPGVTNVSVNDMVYTPVYGACSNSQIVPAAWCQKLKVDEKYEQAATIPTAFCTALRALEDLAALKKGETVLVCDAMSSIGLACIQVASMYTRKVMLVVENETEEAETLRNHDFIGSAQIFKSTDEAKMRDFIRIGPENSIDVIISNPTNTNPQRYMKYLSPSGRVISIHHENSQETRKPQREFSSPNCSFSKLDLEALAQSSSLEVERLMARVQTLRSQGSIKPIAVEQVHASQVAISIKKQLLSPASRDLVVSWQKTESKVHFQKPKYESKFAADASYLLVGCLSELGRLFSLWAVEQGARHFTYLSRSGIKDRQAQNFIDVVRAKGVVVEIVRGDVSAMADVEMAVASCKRPIRGVVQGALVLKDRLFETTDIDAWEAQIKPRVQGTRNLHSALMGQPLDFFLMWSSMTAVLGTATQSAYLGTCAFMDTFAAFRHTQRLPATSLCLGQIRETGHFKGNPTLANSVARNGLYENEHEEFLQFCDAAILSSSGSADLTAASTNAQLLAGVGPGGLKELDSKHKLESMSWFKEPRFLHLVRAATQKATNPIGGAPGEEGETDSSSSAMDRIRNRIAQLLYVPADDISVEQSMTEYGIDSMVAAELKRWLFATFAKDISTMDILDGGTSIRKLEQNIVS